MKKFLAIVLIAAGMAACNSNADGGNTKDSTTIDSGSMTPAPGIGDTAALKTDTTGPTKPDSGLSR